MPKVRDVGGGSSLTVKLPCEGLRAKTSKQPFGGSFHGITNNSSKTPMFPPTLPVLPLARAK